MYVEKEWREYAALSFSHIDDFVPVKDGLLRFFFRICLLVVYEASENVDVHVSPCSAKIINDTLKVV